MAPGRLSHKELFTYRNLLAIPAKPEARFSEIQVSPDGFDSEDLIVATSHCWITKHTNQGHLTSVSYDSPGKLANKNTSFAACSGSISDFTSCPFDTLLAVGSETGEISVLSIPEKLNPLPNVSSFDITEKHVIRATESSPVDKLAFHSTSRGLLAAGIGTKVAIWNVEHSNQGTPSIELESEAKMWDIGWSWDGRLLSTTNRMGSLELWDPRCSTKVATCNTHDGSGGRKCSRLVWIGDQLLITSVNKRDRQYSVYDPRSFDSPVKTERIDNNNGTLIPLVDPNRSIVYLATRGESTFKWLNFNFTNTMTVEAFHSMLPIPPLAGIAMAPINHQTVDVMRTELCKFVILTKNSQVIPLVIQAPKRQYLDFHADVMPPIRSMMPAQAAHEWLEGQNQTVALISQDPSVSQAHQSPRQTAAVLAIVKPTQVLPKAPVASVAELPTTGHASYGVEKLSSDQFSGPVSFKTTLGPTGPKAHVSTCARWSRKFVNGQTSLRADYEDLRNLSSTFPPDREMIKCTSSFFLVPIGGPGGKLGVHFLAQKGRLPTQLSALINGSNISAFEVDQLDPQRVYIAGEDGKVKIFRVPEAQWEEDLSDAELVLSTSKMERISVIRPHPMAKDVLMTISDDMNQPCVRLWHIKSGKGQISPSHELELPSGTISSAAWSLNGRYIAITNKSQRCYVLDPRQGDKEHWCQGPTHASPRHVQVVWADDQSHLLTSGFSAVGMREVKYHRVNHQQHSIESLTHINFDNSPAALSIHYDPDTSIVFCWSRGERTMNLIELVEKTDPEQKIGEAEDVATYKLEALTPFVNSTIQLGYSFFLKQNMDIKSVEIARCLRLTSNQVEMVSFKIPRHRIEFFQDDIYCETRDFLNPSFRNGQDWLGSNLLSESMARIDLQPPGMSKLSQAQPTKVQINQKALIAKGPQLTDSQKADQYLERLFKSAKRDDHPSNADQNQREEPDEEEEVVGRSRVGAPVDDDW